MTFCVVFRLKSKKKPKVTEEKEANALQPILDNDNGESILPPEPDNVRPLEHEPEDGPQLYESPSQAVQPNISNNGGTSKRCRSRRRTGPPQPPPRTRPYEAPYNFPSPMSPEVADYVRRTKDLNAHRTNPTSLNTQSTTVLFQSRSPKRTNMQGQGHARNASLSSEPMNAPPQDTIFESRAVTSAVTSTSGVRHRRTGSEEVNSDRAQVDEFGTFKRPVSASGARPSFKRSSLSL